MEFYKSRKLNKEEASQLLRAKKHLEKAQNLHPFLLFNQDTKMINHFQSFVSSIRRQYKAYADLSLVVDLIEKGKTSQLDQIDFGIKNNLQGFSTDTKLKNAPFAQARNTYHFQIYQKLKFKAKAVFSLVQEYLETLNSVLPQQISFDLLSKSLKDITKFIFNLKSIQQEKETNFDKELRELKNNLQSDIETKKKIFLANRKEKEINQFIGTKKKDKANMVKINLFREISLIGYKKVNPHKIRVDLKQDKIESKLMRRSNPTFTFLSYSGKDSFLATLNGYGLALVKEGREIFCQKYETTAKNLLDVVYCRGSYYIYNYHPFGKILIKEEDHSQPRVWWE